MTSFYCARSNSSPAVVCADCRSKSFAVQDYDLGMTLTSGQAFRWYNQGQNWIGVVRGRWVSLQSTPSLIKAEVAETVEDWSWLMQYLQLDLDLKCVLATFPEDKPMQAAVAACRGLRLLRQDPWECLASFILSSTKQILQIQQIISLLCQRYGQPVPTPAECQVAYAFPSPARVAALSEADLRGCKMGFRAPFLLRAARAVTEGKLALDSLFKLPLEDARAELLKLHGVGLKITDCVLLFAFGRQAAFPVDVWVMKALRELYFPRRKVNLPSLQSFAASHFGPNAGYAQQYLFHYARSHMKFRNRHFK
jgi:N-glycosylase/DNA lyase